MKFTAAALIEFVVQFLLTVTILVGTYRLTQSIEAVLVWVAVFLTFHQLHLARLISIAKGIKEPDDVYNY